MDEDMEALFAQLQDVVQGNENPGSSASGQTAQATASESARSALNVSSSSGIEVVSETTADSARPRREVKTYAPFDPSAAARGAGSRGNEPSAAAIFKNSKQLDASLQAVVDNVQKEEKDLRRQLQLGMDVDEDLFSLSKERIAEIRAEVKAEQAAHHHDHGHGAGQRQEDGAQQSAGLDASAGHEDAAIASNLAFTSRVPLLEHAVPLFTRARRHVVRNHGCDTPLITPGHGNASLPWLVLAIAQGDPSARESLRASTVYPDLYAVCRQVGLPTRSTSLHALPSINTAPLLMRSDTACASWRALTQAAQAFVSGTSSSSTGALVDRCWMLLGSAQGVGAWRRGVAVDSLAGYSTPLQADESPAGIISNEHGAWYERVQDRAHGADGAEGAALHDSMGGPDLYQGWSALHPRASRAKGTRPVYGAAIGHYDVHHGRLSTFLWQGTYSRDGSISGAAIAPVAPSPNPASDMQSDLSNAETSTCFSPAVWAASLLLLGANLASEGWNLEQLSSDTSQLLQESVTLLAAGMQQKTSSTPGRVQDPHTFSHAISTACACLRVCLSARAVTCHSHRSGDGNKDEDDLQQATRPLKRARSASGSTQAIGSQAVVSDLPWTIPTCHVAAVVLLTFRLMLDPILNGLAYPHVTAMPALLQLLHTACDVLQLRSCCEATAAGPRSGGWTVVSRTDSQSNSAMAPLEASATAAYDWRREIAQAWIKWTLPEAFGLFHINSHIPKRASGATTGSGMLSPSRPLGAVLASSQDQPSSTSLLLGVDQPILVRQQDRKVYVVLLPSLLCPLHVAFSPSELGSWLTRRGDSSVGCKVALWVAQDKEWRQAIITQYHPPGTHRQAAGDPERLPCHTVAWLDPLCHPPMAGSAVGYSTLCLAELPCRAATLQTWLDAHPEYKQKLNSTSPTQKAERLERLAVTLLGNRARTGLLGQVVPLLHACVTAVERVDADIVLGQTAGLYAWIGGQRVLVSTRPSSSGMGVDVSQFYKRNVSKHWKAVGRHGKAHSSPPELAAGLESTVMEWLQSTLRSVEPGEPVRASDPLSVLQEASRSRLVLGLPKSETSTASNAPTHISGARQLTEAELASAWSGGGLIGAGIASTLCVMAADDGSTGLGHWHTSASTTGAGGRTLVGEPSTGTTPGRPVSLELRRVGLKRSLPPSADTGGGSELLGTGEDGMTAWNALSEALPPPAPTWTPSHGAFAYSRAAVSGHAFPRIGTASSLLRILAAAMRTCDVPGNASSDDAVGAAAAADAGLTPDERVQMLLLAAPGDSRSSSTPVIASHVAVYTSTTLAASPAGTLMRTLAHALTTAILRCGDNTETRALQEAEVSDDMLAECKAKADALARQVEAAVASTGQPPATPVRQSAAAGFTSPIQVLASPLQLQALPAPTSLPSSHPLLRFDPPSPKSVMSLLKLIPILPPRLPASSVAGQRNSQEISKAVLLAHWQRLHALTDCLSVAMQSCSRASVPALRVKAGSGTDDGTLIQSRGKPNRFGSGDDDAEEEQWLWHTCKKHSDHGPAWYLAADEQLLPRLGWAAASRAGGAPAVSAILPLDRLALATPPSAFDLFAGGLAPHRSSTGGLVTLLSSLPLGALQPQAPAEQRQLREWTKLLDAWNNAVAGRRGSILVGEAWGKKVRALHQWLQCYVSGHELGIE